MKRDWLLTVLVALGTALLGWAGITMLENSVSTERNARSIERLEESNSGLWATLQGFMRDLTQHKDQDAHPASIQRQNDIERRLNRIEDEPAPSMPDR